MALTKCDECMREVSDRAEACPHCGFRIAPYASPVATTPIVVQAGGKETSGLAIAGFVFAFLFPFLGLLLSFLALIDISANKATKSGDGLAVAGLLFSGIAVYFWVASWSWLMSCATTLLGGGR